MRDALKTIKNLLIIILILGFLTAGIDYLRMKSGETPIFNIKKYNEKTSVQTYRGLFYIAERTVTASPNESLVDSTNMKYKILIFDVSVPRQFKDLAMEYTIETKETENCTENSKLYYADKEIKVYTYCLDKISIKEKNKSKELIEYLKKDNTFIDDIDSKLDYEGLYSDSTTLMFKSKEDNFTNNGLRMYRCNKPNILDVYIGPENMTMQQDFCTFKDDYSS